MPFLVTIGKEDKRSVTVVVENPSGTDKFFIRKDGDFIPPLVVSYFQKLYMLFSGNGIKPTRIRINGATEQITIDNLPINLALHNHYLGDGIEILKF